MGNTIISGTADNSDVLEVSMISGDEFCSEKQVAQIDLLKVDTEGFDLDVLAGFCGMLRERRVFALQVETTTNLDNRFHVHLERFIHFLHPFGYRLFGLSDFERTIYATKEKLNGSWFCDAVFVRERLDAKLRRDGRN